MKKYLLTVAFILSFLFSYSQNDSIHGIILKIEGKKVFVDLSSRQVKIGTKLNVLVDSSYLFNPITKEKILRQDINKTIIEVKQVYSDYSIAELVSGNFSKLKIGLSVVGIKSDMNTNKNENLRLSIVNSPNAQQNIGKNINITNVYKRKKLKRKNKINHFYVDLMVEASDVTRVGIGAGYNFYPQLTKKVNNFIKIDFNINALFMFEEAFSLWEFEPNSKNDYMQAYNIPQDATLHTNYMHKVSPVPSAYLMVSLFPKKLRAKKQNIFLGVGYSFYNFDESAYFTLNNSTIFTETVTRTDGPDFLIEYQNHKFFINIRYRKSPEQDGFTGTYNRSYTNDYGLGDVALGFLL